MKSIASMIVGKLNEGLEDIKAGRNFDIEADDAAEPKKVYQCTKCGKFYVDGGEGHLCECGGTGKEFADVVKSEDEVKNESLGRRKSYRRKFESFRTRRRRKLKESIVDIDEDKLELLMNSKGYELESEEDAVRFLHDQYDLREKLDYQFGDGFELIVDSETDKVRKLKSDLNNIHEGIEDDELKTDEVESESEEDLADKEGEASEDELEDAEEEAEDLVDEALKMLDKGNFKRFNECFSSRVRMTSKGKLEAIVECCGKPVTSSRRMTSRQKASYKLAEKYNSAPKKQKSTNESVKTRRHKLVLCNEARAVKAKARHILERLGVKYNRARFNEELDQFIEDRDYEDKIKLIDEDDEIGASSVEEMTPSEVENTVADVIKDTGLEVLDVDADVDGESAEVEVRVEDNKDAEVHTSEIEEVLADAFDAPVEIVGPVSESEDGDTQTLTILVNKEDEHDHEDDEEAGSVEDNEGDIEESLARKRRIRESFNRRRKARNESLRKRVKSAVKESLNRRRKMKESLQKDEAGPYFALESTVAPDMYLCNDDTEIQGASDDSENCVRMFHSEEAANSFLQSRDDLTDGYQVVKIKVVGKEPVLTQE